MVAFVTHFNCRLVTISKMFFMSLSILIMRQG